METLSLTEKSELAELEGIIEAGLKNFYEVGSALLRIRDGRLYHDTHETFEDYCRDRWDMGRNYTNKLIASAFVVESLGTIVPTKPINEAQARPLTRLGTKELKQEAWKKVIETAPEGKITARHVARVVSEMTTENTRKEVKKKKSRMRQAIDKEEMVDEAFRRTFDAFYREVQRARLENWKNTSKEASMMLTSLIVDLIEVK